MTIECKGPCDYKGTNSLYNAKIALFVTLYKLYHSPVPLQNKTGPIDSFLWRVPGTQQPMKAVNVRHKLSTNAGQID